MEFNSQSDYGPERNPLPQNQNRPFQLRSLISLVFVGIVFIVAGYFIYQGLKIDPDWKKIKGTVVSIESNTSTESDGTSSTTYAPVVEYKVNGQSYLKKSSVSLSSKPSIGSIKTVAYNPKNPGDAKIVESTTTKLLFLGFPLAGAGCLAYAAFLFFRRKKTDSARFQATPLISPPPTFPPGAAPQTSPPSATPPTPPTPPPFGSPNV